MKPTALLLSLFFLLFISCKKEDTVPNGAATGGNHIIVPLTQGNSWTYRQFSFPQMDTSNFTQWIDGDTTINSVNWVKLFTGDSINFAMERNDVDGLHDYMGTTITDDLIYKYPASVGDHYTTNSSQDTIEVISVDTSITVPAGQFSCYEYQIKEFGNYYLIFVSPGKGYVKAIANENGSITIINELISYHLN